MIDQIGCVIEQPSLVIVFKAPFFVFVIVAQQKL